MCNLLHAIIACNLLHAINCTCNGYCNYGFTPRLTSPLDVALCRSRPLYRYSLFNQAIKTFLK